MLDILRGDRKSSYDQVLRELLERSLKTPRSLAGAFPELSPWSKEDRMKFRDE